MGINGALQMFYWLTKLDCRQSVSWVRDCNLQVIAGSDELFQAQWTADDLQTFLNVKFAGHSEANTNLCSAYADNVALPTFARRCCWALAVHGMQKSIDISCQPGS